MSDKPKSVLGVIPARYHSSRFEGKPLTLIAGVPMIKRTYLQACKSAMLDAVIVATDDSRILDYCTKEQIPVTMTSTACLTGTDRVAEVAINEDYDFYINIQGDEPVINPACIDQLLEMYACHGDSYVAYNLYKYIEDKAEIGSVNIIKTITNELDEMMYMSRLPIPYSNSEKDAVVKQQIPVYGFTKEALSVFASSAKTANEQFEDIEMLRFVDLGYKVKMVPTTVTSIAVDTPADVLKVEKYLKNTAAAK